MKKYGKIAGIVIALILVIGLASFAYGKLKNQIQSPSLVPEAEEAGETENGNAVEEAEDSGKEAETEDSVEEAEREESGKEIEKEDAVRDAEKEDFSGESAQDDADASDTDSRRKAAIDVGFYDSEGNPVKLSDFYGKPVVMNFWATWCGYCKQEMPDFQEAFEEYGEQVEFLFINSTDGVRETREKASSYLEEQGYTVPSYYDEDMEAVYTYSINSLPTTILLDREGRVAAYAPGVVEKETLTNALDVLLSEEIPGE